MAEVPGTRASLSFITGHWNWIPNFPETIRGDSGAVAQRHRKGQQGHEFHCDGAKCINPWFEAATAPNQTLGPVRNEDERPFPAFEFGNELDEEISSGDSDNSWISRLKRFIVIALNSCGNWVQAKPRTVIPALTPDHSIQEWFWEAAKQDILFWIELKTQKSGKLFWFEIKIKRDLKPKLKPKELGIWILFTRWCPARHQNYGLENRCFAHFCFFFLIHDG